MAYGLIVENVLVQKQYKEADGFIVIPDDAVCGQIWDGTTFSNPEPDPPYEPEYPDAVVVRDIGTGEPVKVVIKDGTVYTGGIDGEIT